MSKKVSGRDVSVSGGEGPGGTRTVSRMRMAGDEEDEAPAAGDSVAMAMTALRN
jgi:hypothetical protein